MSRQVTITDGQGTRSFGYDEDLALTNELVVGTAGPGGPFTNAIARLQDALGRSAGHELFDGGTRVVASAAYGYSDVGRFSSITSIVCGTTNNWQYEYLPDSELLLSVSNAPSEVMTVRNYEANRNLLTNIHHRVGTVALSGFAYGNDALGRRIGRGDHRYYGMGMPDDVGNSFAYNARSELTNAVMGERNYGWSFDNIGNRQTYSTNVRR